MGSLQNKLSRSDALTFSEARDYISQFKFKNVKAFCAWYKDFRPTNIPAGPNSFYANEWTTWGDFLGNGRVADKSKHKAFLTYEEARSYVSQFGFQSEQEFYSWAKTSARPENIPASPRKSYLNSGWVSMGDFLGNGNIHTKSFRSYQETKVFVQSLGLVRYPDWLAWSKSGGRPEDIPAAPPTYYKGEWEGWPKFLGYRQKVSYGERVVANFLEYNGIPYKTQYPLDGCTLKRALRFDFAVFSDPDRTSLLCLIEYHGKQHYEDTPFFNTEHTRGTDQIKSRYCNENQISTLIIPFDQIDNTESILIGYLAPIFPNDTLTIPDRSNLSSAIGWLPWEECREYALTLELKTQSAWHSHVAADQPKGCPSDPSQVYRDCGWVSWEDFLGTDSLRRVKRGRDYLTFEECQIWMKENGIKSSHQWNKRRGSDRPPFIPSNPHLTYKDLWPGWTSFLAQVCPA